MEMSSFKMFMIDVGLLGAKGNIAAKVLLDGCRIFEEFKGALTEQYVLQELSLFPQLNANYYWTSDANAEVDFLFSDGLYAYPLEAKAGNNVHAKSLKVYDKEYNPQLLFRTSLLPYEKNGKLVNIPLYLLFALPRVLTF